MAENSCSAGSNLIAIGMGITRDVLEIGLEEGRRRTMSYEDWSDCLQTYLLSQDLWHLIIDQPMISSSDAAHDVVTATATATATAAWRRKNAAALHAIKISCGSSLLRQVRGITSAKEAWDALARIMNDEEQKKVVDDAAAKLPPQLPSENVQEASWARAGDNNNFKVVEDSVRRGHVAQLREFIQREPESVTWRLPLSDTWQGTALHLAAKFGKVGAGFLLIESMREEELEIKDSEGSTAFHIAVAGGWRPLVVKMLSRNRRLAAIFSQQVLPLQVASRKGAADMVKLLYPATPLGLLFQDDDGCRHGASVVKFCIHAGIWDIALDMLRRRPSMATTMDANNFNAAIQLSLMPASFPSGTPVAFWLRRLYPYIRVRLPGQLHSDDDSFGMGSLEDGSLQAVLTSTHRSSKTRSATTVENRWHQWFSIPSKLTGLKRMHQLKTVHTYSAEILRLMCRHIASLSTPCLRILEAHGVCEAFQKAVENGTVEFVEEAAKACPGLLEKADGRGRNAFMVAVEYRQEKVFSLLYSFRDRASTLSLVDGDKNTMLHMAGMLSPSANLAHISGAALQMQRELQWFQELDDLMDPMYRDKRNSKGETARQVFVRTHLDLARVGQEWMKETATACSVVGALIITIMFTAALTVPGGNEDTGIPILLHDRAFKVFMISDAISLYASATSVLMFLAILTARYFMKDFLKSLPTKMVIGLSTLFVSIAAMMVTFSATVVIAMDRQLQYVVPIILLAAVPVTLFMLLQFPLLIEICMSTYGPSIFNRNMKPWLT